MTDSQELDSQELDSSFDGYTEEDGQWRTAHKMKRNIKRGPKKQAMTVNGNCGNENWIIDHKGTEQTECSDEVAGQASIRCSGCKYRCHPRRDGQISEALVAMAEFDLLWLCNECKPAMETNIDAGKRIESKISETEKKILRVLDNVKPTKLLEEGKLIESRILESERKIVSALDTVKPTQVLIEQIEDRMAKLEKSFIDLREQQSRVESTIKEQKGAVEGMPKVSQDLRSSADQLKQLMLAKDNEERETNLILHNIPESKSAAKEDRKRYDVDSFYNVAFALLGDTTGIEVQQATRLGKEKQVTEGSSNSDNHSESRPRLMMIKLRNKDVVNSLIKRRTQLKEAGFPNVYLTKDLSPEERMKQRELREELSRKGKDTHVIFRGKVVLRN